MASASDWMIEVRRAFGASTAAAQKRGRKRKRTHTVNNNNNNNGNDLEGQDVLSYMKPLEASLENSGPSLDTTAPPPDKDLEYPGWEMLKSQVRRMRASQVVDEFAPRDALTRMAAAVVMDGDISAEPSTPKFHCQYVKAGKESTALGEDPLEPPRAKPAQHVFPRQKRMAPRFRSHFFVQDRTPRRRKEPSPEGNHTHGVDSTTDEEAYPSRREDQDIGVPEKSPGNHNSSRLDEAESPISASPMELDTTQNAVDTAMVAPLVLPENRKEILDDTSELPTPARRNLNLEMIRRPPMASGKQATVNPQDPVIDDTNPNPPANGSIRRSGDGIYGVKHRQAPYAIPSREYTYSGLVISHYGTNNGRGANEWVPSSSLSPSLAASPSPSQQLKIEEAEATISPEDGVLLRTEENLTSSPPLLSSASGFSALLLETLLISDPFAPNDFDNCGISPPKPATTKSHFFEPPKKPSLSCLPFPPLTAPRFGLIQEELADEPFWLLVAVTFLVKTKGTAAIPVFRKLKRDYPTPEALSKACDSESEERKLSGRISQLGLGTKRLAQIKKYAKGFLDKPPAVGKRFWVPGYPGKVVTGCARLEEKSRGYSPERGGGTKSPRKGQKPTQQDSTEYSDGSQHNRQAADTTSPRKNNRQSSKDEENPVRSGSADFPPPPPPPPPPPHPTHVRQKNRPHGPGSRWEIGHLTNGQYALDSWRIFCRDGFLARSSPPATNADAAGSVNASGSDDNTDADTQIETDPNNSNNNNNNNSCVASYPPLEHGPKTKASYPKPEPEPEPEPEWHRVLPQDKELRACLWWMWMREGWEWDPLDGSKLPLREEMRKAVNEGRVAWDDKTGELEIVDAAAAGVSEDGDGGGNQEREREFGRRRR
ncbi:hypothetical protein MKZ38_005631 [Zalerion maritima]|uniref:HhH-GPD domain-containing protein n=1 Tax=Zalerion maritima TaxID=339359 RepID=A0AAD5RXJ2_9PEZI|nr:hypothetical protein MKZ38_005631 [Zalerion maritima]